MQLKDVPVLITGGGSGLGAATARAMAAKGAKVAVLDVRKENADKVAEEIKGVALGADVTNEEQVKAAIAKAEAAHGIARVLVNCAGVGNAARTVGKTGPFPLDVFTRVININLIGTFNVLRLVAERLVTARRSARSAASSSIRRALPPTTARSARRPIRPRRAAWSA